MIAFIRLIFIFLFEFISSNLSVAYTVLFVKRSAIKPRLIEYQAETLTMREKVILAQLITTTPGTITTEIKEKALMIHVLDGTQAEKKMATIKNRLEAGILGVTR